MNLVSLHSLEEVTEIEKKIKNKFYCITFENHSKKSHFLGSILVLFLANYTLA